MLSVLHLRTPAQETRPTTRPPTANGVSIRIPKSVRWEAPTYSRERLKVVMKVPTCPSPEMNLCWRLDLVAVGTVSPGDDQRIVEIWSWVKEKGEGASNREDYQCNHHRCFPANLNRKLLSLSRKLLSNLITEPAKKETSDEHASHVHRLGDRLPREKLRSAGFAHWQHLKILDAFFSEI